MNKRVIAAALLFIMISIFTLNLGQPIKYIAEKDPEIEWQGFEDGSI